MIERIPMVNVTARISDQTGSPVQRARITMRLTTVEKYCGLIVPREVTQYTDANGVASLRVWPNELGTESSEYMVTIMYGDASCSSARANPCGCGNSTSLPATSMSQRFHVVVPNCDCNLFDIANLPPYEQRGAGSVLPAEVASYAAQAAASADRALSAQASVETAMADIDALASAAKLAGENAQIAASQAHKQAHRAEGIVDSMHAEAMHFQNCVISQTEKLATKLGQDAVACIKQNESSALLAIEKRTGDALSEISRAGCEQKMAARNVINVAREAAITQITDIVNKAETDFREEAALFGADFEALTERAESAAKRAGCSAASAANSAMKACLCAERAEHAAQGMEENRLAAEAAARLAETSKTCAEAAATRAERSADLVQQNADYAAGSAKAAQEAAKAADASAALAKAGAAITTEAQQAVARDREIVEEIAADIAGRIQEAATEILTEEIVNDAVDTATKRAEAAAATATEKAAEASADADKAKAEADNAKTEAETADNQARLAEAAKEAAEAAAQLAAQKADLVSDVAGYPAMMETNNANDIAQAANIMRLSNRLYRIEALMAQILTTSAQPAMMPA